eukprot:2147094-Rhodomonas_salina.1
MGEMDEASLHGRGHDEELKVRPRADRRHARETLQVAPQRNHFPFQQLLRLSQLLLHRSLLLSCQRDCVNAAASLFLFPLLRFFQRQLDPVGEEAEKGRKMANEVERDVDGHICPQEISVPITMLAAHGHGQVLHLLLEVAGGLAHPAPLSH